MYVVFEGVGLTPFCCRLSPLLLKYGISLPRLYLRARARLCVGWESGSCIATANVRYIWYAFDKMFIVFPLIYSFNSNLKYVLSLFYLFIVCLFVCLFLCFFLSFLLLLNIIVFASLNFFFVFFFFFFFFKLRFENILNSISSNYRHVELYNFPAKLGD